MQNLIATTFEVVHYIALQAVHYKPLQEVHLSRYNHRSQLPMLWRACRELSLETCLTVHWKMSFPLPQEWWQPLSVMLPLPCIRVVAAVRRLMTNQRKMMMRTGGGLPIVPPDMPAGTNLPSRLLGVREDRYQPLPMLYAGERVVQGKQPSEVRDLFPFSYGFRCHLFHSLLFCN